MKFGEYKENLFIDGVHATYGVLNERDTRAAAGIMLVIGIFAFVQALILRNFTPLTVVVLAFFVEFIIRVFNPNYAPFYALGKFFVKNQRPEWSGAIQKRFAWSLGLAMATSMIIIAVLLGMTGIVPFTICSICLALLWFESALGICVGCKLYYGMQHLGWVKKPEVAPACPGGVCSINKKK